MITDKIAHGITEIYERVLFPELDAVPEMNILELGVWQGGSIRWMRERFPTARITGVDIKVLPGAEDIDVRLIDQTDAPGLNQLAADIGPWDLIIDDASHIPDATMASFRTLWQHVKHGGWYCIEDWIAGYWVDKAYHGLHHVIFDIAKAKDDFGISEMLLFCRAPKCSVAMFRKRPL